MAFIPDEIIIARMMTALDLEFERALHYYDDGYESNNDYGLPTPDHKACLSILCIYIRGLL